MVTKLIYSEGPLLNCRIQFKAYFCGRSLAEFEGSNHTGWKSVCCGCCVLSGMGLCYELITRPEDFY